VCVFACMCVGVYVYVYVYVYACKCIFCVPCNFFRFVCVVSLRFTKIARV